MAEREALQRQIQLLQNLIDRHKSVHGDAPVPSSEAFTKTSSNRTSFTRSTARTAAKTTPGSGPRLWSTAGTRPQRSGGAHSQSSIHRPGSSSGFPFGSRSGTWKKTYSLNNNSSMGPNSSKTQTQRLLHTDVLLKPSTVALNPAVALQRPVPTSQPRLVPGSASDPPPRSSASLLPGLQINKPTTVALKPDKTLDKPSHSQNKISESVSFPSNLSNSSLTPPTAVFKPSTASDPPAQSHSLGLEPHVKPKNTSTLQKTPVNPSLSTAPPSPTSKTPSRLSVTDLTSKKDPTTKNRVSSASEKPAIYSQRGVDSLNVPDSEGKPLLNSDTASQSASDLNETTPASVKPTKKSASLSCLSAQLKRAAAPAAPALKRVNCSDTTRFTWIRPVPATGKHSPGPSSSSEASGGDSSSAPIRRRLITLSRTSSRYQWVSRVHRPKPGASPKVSPKPGLKPSPKHWSRFKWSAPLRSEVKVGSTAVAMETGSSFGFRLRSRTTIIRRNSPGPGPSEVQTPSGPKLGLKPRSDFRTHISVSRHKFQRISSVQTRTKDLVSVSRHKLRRISPGLQSKASAGARSGSGVSPPQKVFRSRFKMDKRAVVCPGLSWRSRRVQTARTFLQSRLRSPDQTQTMSRPAVSQGWSSKVCWIRGSLYRVSRNRLSKTTARTALPTGKTGGTPGSAHYSPAAAMSRSSSRHLARCVLQRSLSIARASRLKQRQRQFCMFFNRFGRCNRGDQCLFIHDPEKVAVCTRFLRGRCKGDSCPFSHKVSKDKMPVCSFFLRGICSNSDCPYSHVYVSRNAQICQDFVRGYCPVGQKCKRKHTLVCPDPDCRRRDTCKLQHKSIRRATGRKLRPHSKRSAANWLNKPSTPQTPEPASTSNSGPGLGPGLDPGPGLGLGPGLSPDPGPLQKLPSFISLCSSPEKPEAPQTPVGAPLHKVSERILQIKPRL